jgi:2-phospho-L-lactate guanylyltransferase
LLKSTLIVIPVKALDKAKSRLESLLTQEEKQGLILAMLHDVTKTITKTGTESDLYLLSKDQKIVNYAESHTLGNIRESHDGLNCSIQDATYWAMEEGYNEMLVIPSDLPLITETDISRLLSTRNKQIVVLSPSKDGGTNAFLRRPPDIIKSNYGKDSFKKHMELAKSAGCDISVVKSQTLAFDIDTLQDLSIYASMGFSNCSGRYIKLNQIDKKLCGFNRFFKSII